MTGTQGFLVPGNLTLSLILPSDAHPHVPGIMPYTLDCKAQPKTQKPHASPHRRYTISIIYISD